MCNKLIAGLLVPAALTLAISSTLHAQTLPQPGDVLRQNAAPAMLPQAPGQVLTLPEPAEQDGEAQTPVPVSHIVLQGNTLVSSAELEAMARPFEGRTVTLGDLQCWRARKTAPVCALKNDPPAGRG